MTELEGLLRSHEALPEEQGAAVEALLRRASILLACGKHVSGGQERGGGGGCPAGLRQAGELTGYKDTRGWGMCRGSVSGWLGLRAWLPAFRPGASLAAMG